MKPIVSGIATLLVLMGFAFEAAARPNAGDKRQKVIDFEDEVVEGLNRRPLDSLSQVSERDKKRKKPHLYRKRVGFKTENAETLRALRYTP